MLWKMVSELRYLRRTNPTSSEIDALRDEIEAFGMFGDALVRARCTAVLAECQMTDAATA